MIKKNIVILLSVLYLNMISCSERNLRESLDGIQSNTIQPSINDTCLSYGVHDFEVRTKGRGWMIDNVDATDSFISLNGDFKNQQIFPYIIDNEWFVIERTDQTLLKISVEANTMSYERFFRVCLFDRNYYAYITIRQKTKDIHP